MPPTKKKIVRKKAVRRKTAPKKTGHQTTRTKNRQLDNDSLTAELNQSIATTEMFPDQTTKQTHYIAVDADNDDLTKKNRLVWLIVAIIGLMITGFWFSTLRQNIAQTASAGDLKEIADQVSQNINEIKNIFSEVKATSQETVSQYQDLQQLEQLKTNTLKEIELNLDSAAWPENMEKSLNLSLKSPSGWTRKNDGQSIVIASYDDPNNLPESLGQLMITKRENPTKTTLTDWTDKNLNADYSFDKEIFIDFQPALKYHRTNATTTEISYSIFTEKNGDLYELNVYTRNGHAYLAILEKIISTLKFLQ